MIINKLRTSLQFGIYQKSLTTLEFCKLTGAKIPTAKGGLTEILVIDAIRLRLRNDYDQKVSAALTREMIVNEINKPDRLDYDLSHKVGNDAYFKELKEWQDAENKVILERFIHHQDEGAFYNYDLMVYIRDFGNDEWLLEINGEGHVIQTLEELALLTEGKIKIKNINL